MTRHGYVIDVSTRTDKNRRGQASCPCYITSIAHSAATMSLSAAQRDALSQLTAITASATASDRERDERLLRENGWNVQVRSGRCESDRELPWTRVDEQATIEQIFSTGGAGGEEEREEVPRPEAPAPREPGTRRTPHTRPARGTGGLGTAGAGIGVLDVVFAPFRLVIGLISGVWYFIGELYDTLRCSGQSSQPQ